MARYALIKKNDIANGLGIRTTFWVQGCRFHCKNCHNKEQWNFDGGYLFTEDTIKEVINYISSDGVMRNLTILGGEPFEDTNIQMCIDTIQAVRREYPNINIWIYSGYTYENLIKDVKKYELLKLCDVLVDGLFIQALYDIRLKFRGSSNQRLIDIPQSINKNSIITIDF